MSEPLTTLVEKARQHVFDLCSGKEHWTMRIPARPEMDSDFVILAAIDAQAELIRSLTAERDAQAERIRVLEAALRELLNDGVTKWLKGEPGSRHRNAIERAEALLGPTEGESA